MLAQEVPQAVQTPTWQSVLALFVLLAFFGYLGWQRGAAREVIVTGAIIVAHLVRTEQVGQVLIGIINSLWLLVSVTVKARFSLEQMVALARSGEVSPLIPAERQEAALFLLFFLVLFLGYKLSMSMSAHPSPLGFLLGMVNGYLIGATVLPLLPRTLPLALPGEGLSAQQREEAISVMREGLRQLGEVLGVEPVYLIMALIALFLVWAALELR